MDFGTMFENWPKIDLGEGAFYAVFGFLFVFLGIALLIAVIYLVGLVMTKLGGRKHAKKEEPVPAAPIALEVEEGISPEIVAAITAAVSVCMEEERQKCEFVVRKIKRI